MNNFDYKNLTPFKWFVLENFPFIENDFDAINNYHLFSKVVEYLNKTIDNMNLTGEQMENVTNAMTELQNYVNNYFENLDVQEEINNKLDEMVESGQLQSMIETIFENLNSQINGINELIGNKNNLMTLNKTSIVESINNNDSSNSLFFGKILSYEVPDDSTGHMQGCCQEGQFAYVAVQGTEPAGFIYKFNINDHTFVERYSLNRLGHGNSMCIINNVIYIASLDGKTITTFNLSNGVEDVINPFDNYSLYNQTYALSEYEGKLFACLTKNSGNTSNFKNNDVFLLYNLLTSTITEYTIEDPYNLLDFTNNITRQSFCCFENTMYILLQGPNVIVKARIDNNNHKIIIYKFYNFSKFDFNNCSIGETEDLQVVKNDNYPTGTILINSRTQIVYQNTNNRFGGDIINLWCFNEKINVVEHLRTTTGYWQRPLNNYYITSVNKTQSNLFEIGNSAFPFRNLITAINDIQNAGILYIRDSGTYHIPHLINRHAKIMVEGSNQPTIYLGVLVNCKLTFETVGASSKITIKGMLGNKYTELRESELILKASSYNIEINDTQIKLSESTLKTRRCVLNNPNTTSSGYDILLDDNSIFIDGISNWTTANSNKVTYGGNSIVYSSLASGIVKTGIGALIVFS